MTITRHDAERLIGETFGDLEETLQDGLPGGSDEDWGYDEQLVLDIGEACRAWKARHEARTRG